MYIVKGLKVLGVVCVIQIFMTLIGQSLVDLNTFSLVYQFIISFYMASSMTGKLNEYKKKIPNKIYFVLTLSGAVTFVVLYYIEFRVNWFKSSSYSAATFYEYIVNKLNTANIMLYAKYREDTENLTAGVENYFFVTVQIFTCLISSFMGTDKLNQIYKKELKNKKYKKR